MQTDERRQEISCCQSGRYDVMNCKECGRRMCGECATELEWDIEHCADCFPEAFRKLEMAADRHEQRAGELERLLRFLRMIRPEPSHAYAYGAIQELVREVVEVGLIWDAAREAPLLAALGLAPMGESKEAA